MKTAERLQRETTDAQTALKAVPIVSAAYSPSKQKNS